MFEYESNRILDSSFGETQDVNWKFLAKEIGGEFHPGIRDDWGSQSKVIYRVETWTITLEAYKYISPGRPSDFVMHTRIIANYLTNDHFSFWVTTPSLIDELKIFLGLENKHDIKIGETALDQKYLFCGSNVQQTRKMFENTNLRRMLLQLDGISYGVKGADQWLSKTYRKKSVHLYYHHPHLIYDIKRLRLLIELFSETLKQLQHIGSLITKEQL
jgi:hypothetical protein